MVESKKDTCRHTEKKRGAAGAAKDFPVRPPSDMAPSQGGSVRRNFGPYGERSLPVVLQSAFSEEGESTTEVQANSHKGLRKLQPIEDQLHRSSQGTRTPEQDILAEQQRLAIRRTYVRKRRKPK